MINGTAKLLVSCMLKITDSTNPDQLVHMPVSADQSEYSKNGKRSVLTDKSIMHLDPTIKLDQDYPAYFIHLDINCPDL